MNYNGDNKQEITTIPKAVDNLKYGSYVNSIIKKGDDIYFSQLFFDEKETIFNPTTSMLYKVTKSSNILILKNHLVNNYIFTEDKIIASGFTDKLYIT
jgi:hypothetical protein